VTHPIDVHHVAHHFDLGGAHDPGHGREKRKPIDRVQAAAAMIDRTTV